MLNYCFQIPGIVSARLKKFRSESNDPISFPFIHMSIRNNTNMTDLNYKLSDLKCNLLDCKF